MESYEGPATVNVEDRSYGSTEALSLVTSVKY